MCAVQKLGNSSMLCFHWFVAFYKQEYHVCKAEDLMFNELHRYVSLAVIPHFIWKIRVECVTADLLDIYQLVCFYH